MTRDEILAIPVGPALDRAVAEQVLRLPPCEYWETRYTRDRDAGFWGDSWFRKDGIGECPHDWSQGWPGGCFPALDWREGLAEGGWFDMLLSTDIDTAIRLVKATGPLPRGWVWVLQTMKDGVLGYFAIIGYPRHGYDSMHALAEAGGASFPEAVCRAALLASADQELLP